MIVRMYKTHVACAREDRDKLLSILRDMGVIHLQPVDAGKAQADAPTLSAIDQLGRAIQMLESIEPAGETPDVDPLAAAAEAMEIDRRASELRAKLANLHRMVEQLEIWGDVRLEQFAQLEKQGLHIRFYAVDAADAGRADLGADCVQIVGQYDKKRALVAAVFTNAPADEAPQGAELVPLPTQDRPAVLAEARIIDEELMGGRTRLSALANLLPAMRKQRAKLQQEAQWTVASRSGLDDSNFFAIQGWVPRDRSATLGEELLACGVHSAVEILEPAPEENPPTLVRYARWATPIKGLFDILGTSPGYREIDLSSFFMIALPLFAAMLIGDFGYGLIFALVPLLMYRRLTSDRANKPKIDLLIVVGVATMIWGVLTATYFGMTPDTFRQWGATGAIIADITAAAGPLYSSDAEAGRNLLIKVSFIIGIIHLTLAHLRRAAFLAPSQQAVAEIGWVVFMWGMLGVIWSLFFGASGGMLMPATAIYWLLGIGGAMVVLFLSPDANPVKRVGKGLANALLPALGTFSDTMSYIRLMAVGLASYYIADAFNRMAGDLAGAATWAAGGPVLVLGHALNIALAMIAIFAHGVRLNMLEFSNNAGVQWAGYNYEPFAAQQIKEN
ncbi:MAG: hypothetical protein GXY38_11565 [Planctomycetes bacterium]|jgi:V/A-type H+-transporting ATPase subunit I|nr:hypothetical protein [Planctomycetota bacterium]